MMFYEDAVQLRIRHLSGTPVDEAKLAEAMETIRSNARRSYDPAATPKRPRARSKPRGHPLSPGNLAMRKMLAEEGAMPFRDFNERAEALFVAAGNSANSFQQARKSLLHRGQFELYIVMTPEGQRLYEKHAAAAREAEA